MSETQKAGGLLELRSALRRRRWPVFYTFVGVMIAALLAEFLWPPTYVSTGTILIEQQDLPTDFVRSAINGFADQRIQVITQRVMTTENLFRIIERYNLYPGLRKSAPREKILKRMRDDINFQMISADVIDPRAGHPTKATIAFSVSYSNRSPDLAARVANELVSLYLQVNIDSRKQDAENASSFLAEESARLDQQIKQRQVDLAKFKEAHFSELPDMNPINTQLLNRTDDDLRDVQTQIRALDQQVIYLDAQLAQISPSSQVYTSTGERVLSPADRLKYLRTEYSRVSGIYSPYHPDVLRLQREIASLEKTVGTVDSSNDISRQLQDTETQLALAKQKYAPDHPDVLRLQRLVDALKAQAQSESKKVPTAVTQPDNPAYLELKAQRDGNVEDRKSLLEKEASLKAKRADLEQRLSGAPAVERDYAAIVRDMENDQIKYREVRQKQMEAQVSQNLEDERKGERFALIEPPVTPEQPDSPNGTVILVAGLVVALASALGMMFLLENLDTSIRGFQDLEAILGVPPLAILPVIETNAERALRARRKMYALIGGGVGVLVLLILINFLYLPLDVLWHVGMRRLFG